MNVQIFTANSRTRDESDRRRLLQEDKNEFYPENRNTRMPKTSVDVAWVRTHRSELGQVGLTLLTCMSNEVWNSASHIGDVRRTNGEKMRVSEYIRPWTGA